MKQDRMNGIIIGILYIVAAVTSIIAVISYQPILSEQWFMTVETGFETKILIGVLNDLLLVAAAVGTAIMLFPYIRRWNEHIALGYLCFRFMEAVFISVGVVSILSLLQLSMYVEAGSIASENLHAAGLMLQSFHRWIMVLGPNLMLGLNTIMYSYLLFRTGLVPKPLAVFGMGTAVMVFISGLLDMFGIIDSLSAVKGLTALPVGVYEMSLAVWLIVKGFDKQKLEKLKA
ncbi:DUF4386 family protein [Oceanobacillus sp. 143]|uniref:DUF4386 domain-containing protein n=1 Tax=Oceanobacillus zhaokaii TaxID=2052660 RepID=A0A345PK45_9BACI|nr:DUF4386 domain-containing protein [Oceanobacillus zhaokaii]AXI10375.1 DUF4386 domain-containing protein [Oceanobacillus zhaokaii]QGS69416.1 DUF4386 family protein [Oceanobacillus sp. 143]